MTVNIDFRSRTPIYEQLINEIKSMAVSGTVSPDEKLPSVRQLSAELGINPNTIQKAYTELERTGVIYTASGKGSFISPDTEALSAGHRKKISCELSAKIAEALAAGITVEEIAKLTSEISQGGDCK